MLNDRQHVLDALREKPLKIYDHSETQFSEKSFATKAATELLSRYPMLQVEIYDAKAKTRTRVEQGKAVVAE